MTMNQGAIARDSTSCNPCNYSDSSYWDRRYADDPKPFDWYQCYAGVSPLVRKYIPLSSRVLMVGCGNAGEEFQVDTLFCWFLAVMSEDMVKDGYNDIINIDISPVVIEAMQKKYHNVSQLKYMTMDVLDLSSFDDCTFDSVIDKGTLDSIMCGVGAPYNAAIMLAEISRVLRPGGVYMLITYGDPRLRMPHLNRNTFGWSITLYTIPQPCSRKALEDCLKAYSEPVSLNDDGTYANNYVLEDLDSYFVYVCMKEP